jgi:hypothetical protein
VGRLAARHGIKVRLQPAKSGGLSALVWLPDTIVVLQDTAAPSGLGGLAAGESRRAAHHAAALEPAVGAFEPPGVTDPDRGLVEQAAIARSPRPAPTPQDVLVGQPPAANLVPGAGPEPRHLWSAGASRPDFRARPPAPGPGPVRSQPPVAAGNGDEPAVSTAGAASGAQSEPAENGRLPIYDAVESHWFGNRQSGGSAAAEGGGASPAGRGWRAAKTVITPSSDGVTTAGLPVRVPRANLVPGAISGVSAAPAAPRSATAARDRLSGLQRGIGQGRAAASATATPDGEDKASAR